ncbi:MAG: hypothetical protein WCO23_04695 [bacterium]
MSTDILHPPMQLHVGQRVRSRINHQIFEVVALPESGDYAHKGMARFKLADSNDAGCWSPVSSVRLI